MTDSGSQHPQGAPKFIVVDDHAVVAAGMASLLSQAYPGSHIETKTSLEDALESVKIEVGAPMPDGITIVLLDLMLGELSGLEFLRATRDTAHVRTIVLSGVNKQEKIDACRDLGAKGFVSKTADPKMVLGAISAVVAGREYFALGKAKVADAFQAALAKLSPQMRRVFDQILEGKADKDIAQELGIERSTVKKYTNAIYRVLSVENRKELMARFIVSD